MATTRFEDLSNSDFPPPAKSGVQGRIEIPSIPSASRPSTFRPFYHPWAPEDPAMIFDHSDTRNSSTRDNSWTTNSAIW